MRLKGKSAFITGAASGQGRAAAKLFAEEGANLLVFDRDAAGASATTEGIREAVGSAHVCVGDVSRSADVAAGAARDTFGGVHALYNNAAVWAPRESMPDEVRYPMLVAPNTHFVTFAQSVLYRGAGLDVVWPQILGMIAIGATLYAIALRRFRGTIQTLT